MPMSKTAVTQNLPQNMQRALCALSEISDEKDFRTHGITFANDFLVHHKSNLFLFLAHCVLNADFASRFAQVLPDLDTLLLRQLYLYSQPIMNSMVQHASETAKYLLLVHLVAAKQLSLVKNVAMFISEVTLTRILEKLISDDQLDIVISILDAAPTSLSKVAALARVSNECMNRAQIVPGDLNVQFVLTAISLTHKATDCWDQLMKKDFN